MKPLLKQRHHQELKASAISETLINLNFKSIEGDEAWEHICYALPHSERKNTGQLRAKWLRTYDHLTQGGWYCQGLDDWGCLKPDQPRPNPNKPGQFIKYEHPPKAPGRIFQLKVSYADGLAVARQHGLETTYAQRIPDGADRGSEDPGFWTWVIAHPAEVPILVTEGAKKTGAGLSAGVVTLGLPGINMGYRKLNGQDGKEWGRSLHPDLLPFCQPGREFIFGFDNDTKHSTIQRVRSAISTTGRLLQQQGCKVSVMVWDHHPEKGLDDLIAAHGLDEFHQLHQSHRPLSDWEERIHPDQQLNSRYLPTFTPPADKRLVGYKSPKGTGKTTLLAKLAQQARDNSQKTMVLTHRIQLGKALCDAFGVDYISDCRESAARGALGMGLCIDSILKTNPSEWSGAWVVLDEAAQILNHLLNADTEVAKHRPKIIQHLKACLGSAIAGGGRIILSDADLDFTTLDFFMELTELSRDDAWILENTHVPNQGRSLASYESPGEVVSAAQAVIETGQPVYISVSGQRVTSRYGSRNLETHFRAFYPHLKTLRIDAETISDPTHEAYGCITDLNEVLPRYDIIIASPAVETGVSIDVPHFAAVFGIYTGVQTVQSVCQALERVRAGVARHIYVAPKRPNFCRLGNGETSPKALLYSTSKKTQGLLKRLGIDPSSARHDDLKPARWAWAKIGARSNQSCYDYRESALEKLQTEGYQVSTVPANPDRAKPIDEALGEIRDAANLAENKAISAADALAEPEYRVIKGKRALTLDERHQLRRYETALRYATLDVTPELIQQDKDGWYSEILTEYHLGQGSHVLEPQSRKWLNRKIEDGDGVLFGPDTNKRATHLNRVMAIAWMNLAQFLDPDINWHKDHPAIQECQALMVKHRAELRIYCNFNVRTDANHAIQNINQALGWLGYKLSHQTQHRVNGLRRRDYRFIAPLDGRGGVFERWLERDLAAVTADFVQSQTFSMSCDSSERVSEGQMSDGGLAVGDAFRWKRGLFWVSATVQAVCGRLVTFIGETMTDSLTLSLDQIEWQVGTG